MARDRDDDDYDDEDERPRRRRRRDDDEEYKDYDDEPRGSPPPNYLVLAIFVTLCCCLIGGIVAIVNAAQVNSKWSAGDRAGALKASNNAKMWCIASICIGAVTNAIVGVLQVMAAQQGAGR